MKTSFLGRVVQLRRLLRSLDRIATALESQTRHMQRIGDYLVGPEVLPATDEDLKVHSGVSFSTDQEQSRIIDLADRFEKASGRTPTDDELMDLIDGRRH